MGLENHIKQLIESLKEVQLQFWNNSNLDKVTITYDNSCDDNQIIFQVTEVILDFLDQPQEVYSDESIGNDGDIMDEWGDILLPFLIANEETGEDTMEITRDILNHSFLHILA